MSQRRHRSSRSPGYTAVEVLMGLTLFAIGAAAVISMQRSAIQANLDARKMDVANSIAREWLERLRRDATLWTLPSPVNPNLNNYTNAALLSTYLPYSSANMITAWSYPNAYLSGATSPDGVSTGFDILGRDLKASDIVGTAATPSKAIFCVNIRLNWLVFDQLIRAEVRVFWPRGLGNGGAYVADWCSAANAASVTGDTATYHFVYAATAIRQNTTQ